MHRVAQKKLENCFNDNTTNNNEFPDELKLAEVMAPFKRDDPTKSKNYRPGSVLPTVSKMSEKIMHR